MEKTLKKLQRKQENKNSCFFATTDSFVLFFFVHKKTMLEIFYCFHNIVFYNIKYYVSYM